MKSEDPLHKRLSVLAVPEPDPAARDRALDAAIAELRSAPPAPRQPRHFFPMLPGWAPVAGLAVLALCVVLALSLAIHHPIKESLAVASAEPELRSQMEALFGSQLDAVVESPGRSPDIHLAANPADGVQPSLAQPVLIQFRRIGKRGVTRVLSYSGRSVCVVLGERRVCFEPLVTGQGEVILNGETFCWAPGQPVEGLPDYQVTAHVMPRLNPPNVLPGFRS